MKEKKKQYEKELKLVDISEEYGYNLQKTYNSYRNSRKVKPEIWGIA